MEPQPGSALFAQKSNLHKDMDSPAQPSTDILALSPKQRRLRAVTLVILTMVIMMVVAGATHPFFRPAGRPPVMTERIEQAIKVKILMIGFYWITCLLLTTTLFILAWLDLREVRRKLLLARRDMWKNILEQHRERRADGSSTTDDA